MFDTFIGHFTFQKRKVHMTCPLRVRIKYIHRLELGFEKPGKRKVELARISQANRKG
jgi:hypothetical protein